MVLVRRTSQGCSSVQQVLEDREGEREGGRGREVVWRREDGRIMH